MENRAENREERVGSQTEKSKGRKTKEFRGFTRVPQILVSSLEPRVWSSPIVQPTNRRSLKPEDFKGRL